MVVKSLGGPHSLTSLGHMNPITLRSFVALQVYENWILVIMKKKSASFKETTTGITGDDKGTSE